MKFNRLAKLVSLASSGIVALSAPSYAVESNEESVERIEVTGSRLNVWYAPLLQIIKQDNRSWFALMYSESIETFISPSSTMRSAPD
ncbi:hypothetical protein, partial [Shewanella nanhaiensis]